MHQFSVVPEALTSSIKYTKNKEINAGLLYAILSLENLSLENIQIDT